MKTCTFFSVVCDLTPAASGALSHMTKHDYYSGQRAFMSDVSGQRRMAVLMDSVNHLEIGKHISSLGKGVQLN